MREDVHILISRPNMNEKTLFSKQNSSKKIKLFFWDFKKLNQLLNIIFDVYFIIHRMSSAWFVILFCFDKTKYVNCYLT